MTTAYELLQPLGFRHPREFSSLDDWYEYLINDFIPNQGYEDLIRFIELRFDPIACRWKASSLKELIKKKEVLR
ncbi:hypothetical protein DRP04_02150 [Archaeoglobales archaeon]|nr:MAG: hypothetical protein DRP04_02150 [Archaeoglobales archaeon]